MSLKHVGSSFGKPPAPRGRNRRSATISTHGFKFLPTASNCAREARVILERADAEGVSGDEVPSWTGSRSPKREAFLEVFLRVTRCVGANRLYAQRRAGTAAPPLPVGF